MRKAVCAHGARLIPLARGCELSSRQPPDQGNQHRRRIGYLAVPNLPMVYDVFAHHDCMHNQLVSIHNRVCGLRPAMVCRRDYMMDRLKVYLRRLGRSLGTVGPWSLDRVVQHYTGPKRRRYSEAADTYRAYGLTRKNASVKMFIKCEKIKFSPDKPNPDPRAIQYRDPVYAVVLATFLKPIEEVVYRMKGNRLNRLPPHRVIAKGLNQAQRALLLRTKWERFADPVCMSLDASRFDQHVSDKHLEAEHALYKVMLPDGFFAQLLSWQVKNNVTTSKGVKYKTFGKRMSGDMNTALGNCIIMIGQLALFFENSTLKWDCLDDGDDILLIVERSSVPAIRANIEHHFASLGMQLKVESVTSVFEEIEFCQSRPVCIDGTWKFIRNPAKVMSGALVGQKWLTMPSPRSRRKLANTIGLCEAILNKGVPVLQAFAQAIMQNANTTGQVRLDQAEQLIFRVRAEIGKTSLERLPYTPPALISDDTRLSFSRAFGITVDEQLWCEAWLESWKFGFHGEDLQPAPINVPNWCWESLHEERHHC